MVVASEACRNFLQFVPGIAAKGLQQCRLRHPPGTFARPEAPEFSQNFFDDRRRRCEGTYGCQIAKGHPLPPSQSPVEPPVAFHSFRCASRVMSSGRIGGADIRPQPKIIPPYKVFKGDLSTAYFAMHKLGLAYLLAGDPVAG